MEALFCRGAGGGGWSGERQDHPQVVEAIQVRGAGGSGVQVKRDQQLGELLGGRSASTGWGIDWVGVVQERPVLGMMQRVLRH